MFKIPRREAAITHLNIREEKHGKTSVKAVDVSISFTAKATGDKNIFDILVPVQQDNDNLASEFFFDEGGHLRAPTIQPFGLKRDPEGLVVTLHDRKEPITIANAKAKNFIITPQEGGTIQVTCKIQGIPEKGHVERLKDILGADVDFELEAETDDLFSMPTEPTPEEKTQGELIAASAEGKRPRGTGRNQGLRNSEVKGKDEPAPVDKGKAEKPAAKKKVAAKKKASGKRSGA